ncbi:hypothetical protein LCGC14_1169300 [marine sediment metagenome]|uniref:HNH nuclease domain-containing protein n=1 Tax=marine sediment metagenome TaxID=412755 RepID=A0A0F9LV77_9ZZZZ
MDYKRKDWLYAKYITEELSIRGIADISGVSPVTIYNWLVKFEIPRRAKGVNHWSEEQRQYRRDWNKAHPEINRMKGRHHSEETKRKMSLARQGRKNANWKGGLTELVKGIRRSPEFHLWRKVVLERDGHTCQDCESKENVNAHHLKSLIEYPELVFDVNNGLTLCEECHKRHTSWQRLNRRRNPKSKKQVSNGH